jgi:hypothetical protein
MRLPTPRSKRLIGVTSMACAGLATVAVSLALTTGPAAAAAPPACTSSQLVPWLNSTGSGTTGAIYYAIQFTNITAKSCTLTGYPGVSGVTLGGSQLGSAAVRNDTHKSFVITLASGATASTLSTTGISILKITDVANYPAATCKPVTAGGLRVYIPGQKASTVIPFPFRACSKSGPTYLSVEPIEGGVSAAG